MQPVVFCDFDGTITEVDVTDVILSELAHPSWREVEQEWVRGAIGSRECLERQMALVVASQRQLDQLIDAVPIDPHFADFFCALRRRGVPVYVVSDGFDYVIRRVLRRADIRGRFQNGANLFASVLRFEKGKLVTAFPHASPSCRHGCATCKPGLLRRLGRGRKPAVFIGDGLSDRFAVEKADVVFAKRQLIAYCREKGVACRPFEDFADVLSSWSSIESAGTREARKAALEPAEADVLTS